MNTLIHIVKMDKEIQIHLWKSNLEEAVSSVCFWKDKEFTRLDIWDCIVKYGPKELLSLGENEEFA